MSLSRLYGILLILTVGGWLLVSVTATTLLPKTATTSLPPPTDHPSSPSDLGSNSSPTLSAANVFGLFMTLQLCQLTQPFGSLLFRSSGWVWRCSPLASFVEGCIIITHLFFTRDAADGSTGDFHVAGRGFRLRAKALLLMRSHPEEIGSRNPLPLKQPFVTMVRWLDWGSLTEFSGDRRRTRYAVQDQSHDIEIWEPNPLDNTSSAHKEWRIALFTTLSMVLVFLKICAIRGVPCFTIAALGLIFGWAMVQILILLLHWHPFTITEEARSVELATKLRKSLREDDFLWQICFVVLHLPVYGYGWWRLPTVSPLNFEDGVAVSILRIIAAFLYFSFGSFFGAFHALAFLLTLPCLFTSIQHRDYGEILCSLWVGISGVGCSFLLEFFIYNNATIDLEWPFLSPYIDISRGIFFITMLRATIEGLLESIYTGSFDPPIHNFVVTAFWFVNYLSQYDSTGTSKPDWLEWLG
jgi:hypothetical protein